MAGMTEAKVEVMEFVHFLNDPSRIKDLGGKVPKVRLSSKPSTRPLTASRARCLSGLLGRARLSWPKPWQAKLESRSLRCRALISSRCSSVSAAALVSFSLMMMLLMLPGVGPSRVRDLFEQARAHTPCILYIDEIDAMGKARSSGQGAGGNSERESTLNQLLVEVGLCLNVQ